MCHFRYRLAYPQDREQLPTPFCQPRGDPRRWGYHERRSRYEFLERGPLGEEYPPQVSVQ